MTVNTVRLRAIIGWLGMLLPWIVVILGGEFPRSISATWYTNACTPFMIILGAASFLLISYKGYEKKDDILLTCSGIAGLLICLFPCSIPEVPGKVGTFMVDSDVSAVIHNVSAVLFFGLLAYNSFFLFTKSSGVMTYNKKNPQHNLQGVRSRNGIIVLAIIASGCLHKNMVDRGSSAILLWRELFNQGGHVHLAILR